MHEIGPLLRAAREARDVSLELAEEETKIRKKYLQALENDTPSVIPGDVYVRGFLRSYANWLGLDGAALVEQYKEQQAGAAAPDVTAPSAAPPVGAVAQTVTAAPVDGGAGPAVARTQPVTARAGSAPPMRRKERHKPGSSGLTLLVACGVAALAVGGYFVYRNLGQQAAPPPAPPASQQGAGPTDSTTGTGTAAGSGAPAGNTGTATGSPQGASGTTPPTTPATGTPASTQTTSPKVTMNPPKGQAVVFHVGESGPIDVSLQFSDKRAVYMKVTVDGKLVSEQTTTNPATTHWTGKSITIRLGHADTLTEVKVNGVSFPKPLQGGPFTLTFVPSA